MGVLNNALPDIGPVRAVDAAIGWGRKSSIWPMTFGIACCAIEMMAFAGTRYDVDRLGSGAFRAALGLTRKIAKELRESGTYETLTRDAIPYADVNALLRR